MDFRFIMSLEGGYIIEKILSLSIKGGWREGT